MWGQDASSFELTLYLRSFSLEGEGWDEGEKASLAVIPFTLRFLLHRDTNILKDNNLAALPWSGCKSLRR